VAAGARANATADTPDEGDIAQLSVDLNSNLRTRVDQAQVATGAAAPAQAVQAGVLARSTIPTAVDSGDLVALLGDLYGRLKLAAHDESTGTLLVTDITPAAADTIGPTAWTQITAAGSSTSVNIKGYSRFEIAVVVANIDTDVTVRAEGSNDDSNWFNLDDSLMDTTYTANGTYPLSKDGVSCNYLRFTMVDETGGTSVTLDATYLIGR